MNLQHWQTRLYRVRQSCDKGPTRRQWMTATGDGFGIMSENLILWLLSMTTICDFLMFRIFCNCPSILTSLTACLWPFLVLCFKIPETTGFKSCRRSRLFSIGAETLAGSISQQNSPMLIPPKIIHPHPQQDRKRGYGDSRAEEDQCPLGPLGPLGWAGSNPLKCWPGSPIQWLMIIIPTKWL